MPTLKEAGEGYVKLRNQKKEIEKRHKEELAPLNEAMKKLEAFMLAGLNEQGLENFGAAGATVYKSTRSNVKTECWEDFFEFVKQNEAWEFLTRKPVASLVKDYLEEYKRLPPGVSISSEVVIGVRAK